MNKSITQGVTIFAMMLILASLIMVIIYGSTSCSSGFSGNFDCTYQTLGFCSHGPAFSINLEILSETTFVTCPWSTQTSVLNYIGLAAGLFFLVIAATSPRINPSTLKVGIVAALGLLVGLILMIVDLINGHKVGNGGDGTLSQAPFIANAAMIAVTLICVCVGIKTGVSSKVIEEVAVPFQSA